MKAPVSFNVKPVASSSPAALQAKLNELIIRNEEIYRLLRSDVQIMDFREPPPHYSIDHASWKWIENPTNGDLELWHRVNNVWAKTYWDVRGVLTRPTQPIIT